MLCKKRTTKPRVCVYKRRTNTSMQAHYHIKTFRNEDTTIVLILSKHSGTLNGVRVEILCAKKNIFLGCVPYYMYVF